MRKSCVSLILSALLVGVCEAEGATDLVANFGDKKGGSGNYESATKDSSSTQAAYGTDWYGSDTYLQAKTSNLNFAFKGTNETNLLLKDGFTFSNTIKDTTANIAIALSKDTTPPSNSLTTFLFGQTPNPNNKVTIQSGVNLVISGFTEAKVQSNLFINSGSSLKVSNGSNGKLTNLGGIALEKDSSLEAKTLINDGTIVMGENSKITSLDSISADTSKTGTIDIQSDASLIFNGVTNGASIKQQNITLGNDKTLTIKENSAPTGRAKGTLTLEKVKLSSKGSSTLKVSDFTSLESKDLSLSSVTLQGKALTSLTNTKMSLNNSKIYLGSQTTTPKIPIQITMASDPKEPQTSSFTLTGENLISAGGNSLQVTGNHSFEGGGRLTLEGGSITLGNGDPKTTLSLSKTPDTAGENSDTTLALQAKQTIITNLKLQDLKLQVIQTKDSTGIQNQSLELSGKATIESVDEKGNLANLSIGKNGSPPSSTIKISNGATAILRGKTITLTDQSITLENTGGKATSLIFEANEGSVTLGNGEETQTKIEGKNATLAHNIIDFQTSQVNFGSNVELNKLSITAGGDSGITFYGSQGGSVTFKGGTTLSTQRDGGYKELIFTIQEAPQTPQTRENSQSTLVFSDTTAFKASSIMLQNQKVTLGSGTNSNAIGSIGAGTQTSLDLYALGVSGNEESGAFTFVNTTFSQTPSAPLPMASATQDEIALYANKEAVLLANGLTLDNVNLSSYEVSSGAKTLNALDLSASNGKLTALQTVKIQANGIYSTKLGEKEEQKRVQGIGMDIYVGDSTKVGNLTIQSDEKSESFLIGGDLVIDNSTATNGVGGGGGGGGGGSMNALANGTQSSFEIVLGKNERVDPIGLGGEAPLVQAKLSDQTLALEITGGLTAIGNANPTLRATPTTTEIKAKKFTFGEKSNLTSINGTLKLNTKEDAEIEIKGTTILQGTASAEAKIEVIKTNGAGTPEPVGSSGTSIALKLHDIQSTGKGSITNSGLTFVDSNIKVSANSAGDKLLVLTDDSVEATPTPPSPPPLANETIKNQMRGTIQSIILEGGELEFRRKDSATTPPPQQQQPQPSGQEPIAGIKLNAGGLIQSSGVSKLTVQSINVGKTENDRFDLKITDGTLTLVESETQNKIGTITLGDEEKKQGGNFVFVKTQAPEKEKQVTAYNDLKFNADLSSYGNSSITANSLISTTSSENTKISSKDGELRLNLFDSKGQTLQNDIILQNGSLSFYNSNSQLRDDIAFNKSNIRSSGNSKIEANNLDLNDSTIFASGGTLTLKGIKTNSSVGNVSIGDAGVLQVQNNAGQRAGLNVISGSRMFLGANAPYVSPSKPLGGGSFGQVIASSVMFEGVSEGKLINISLNQAQPNVANLNDDRLFALREGEVVLIDTTEGIKKKTGNAKYGNITLEDIGVDKGGYTSITLTPKLIGGKSSTQEDIIRQLQLGISVSQTTIPQLIESIQNSQSKDIMQKIFSDPLNYAIVESIFQSKDNVFKVGMAEYISSGNVGVVLSSLGYMRGALQGATDAIYASDKIAQELKMLNTSTLENRMARSGNPHASKTEVAYWLKQISKNRYASDDDSLLLDEDITPNYGSLWATYDGAMSISKNDQASVNGLSAGYDTLLGEFKEYLLGFYANYGYGAYSANFVKNTSHNFGLGFYTRMTFKQNEVDLVFSQSIGLNHTDLNLGASQSQVVQMLNQTLKYNFYITDFQARYGYLFSVGNEESPFYFKPFGGINFGATINSEAIGDGEAKIGIEKAINFKLGVSIGLEMKKYFNEGSYIYLLPVLEKGLVNDGGNVKIGFVGAKNIPFMPFYQVDTAFALYAGGQGSVSENISITGGLGVKMDIESQDVLTNWNIGFKYKF